VQTYSVPANGYFTDFLHKIVSGLPAFVGALLLAIVGYMVARIVASSILLILHRVRLNERLHAGKGGNIIQRAVPNPAQVVSKLTFWVVFLFALSLAISILGIPTFVDFIQP
jgi:hypothetical protein